MATAQAVWPESLPHRFLSPPLASFLASLLCSSTRGSRRPVPRPGLPPWARFPEGRGGDPGGQNIFAVYILVSARHLLNLCWILLGDFLVVAPPSGLSDGDLLLGESILRPPRLVR